MIAPMADWMLMVVPVKNRASTTPASTAGMVEMTTRARRSDWKFAHSSRKMTRMAMTRPLLKPS